MVAVPHNELDVLSAMRNLKKVISTAPVVIQGRLAEWDRWGASSATFNS